MNFTIERAAFLTAAKRAAQLVPSASPLEALKCALLEIDTGMRSLHMTATNMEVTLRQDVPLLAYEGGDTTFAIDAKLLSAMLANLPGNTVECCKGDKDTLALSSDHAYYQVPTASGKGFPRMNITAPESMVKLSGVPSMVRRAAFATDPNNSNMPLLRCVNLRLTADGLRAVGSDGVCIVSAKGDKQCTGDQTFLIPAANLEKLAQLCEEKDTFSVGMADRQLVFVKEGFQFAARLMHGSYGKTMQKEAMEFHLSGLMNSLAVDQKVDNGNIHSLVMSPRENSEEAAVAHAAWHVGMTCGEIFPDSGIYFAAVKQATISDKLTEDIAKNMEQYAISLVRLYAEGAEDK